MFCYELGMLGPSIGPAAIGVQEGVFINQLLYIYR